MAERSARTTLYNGFALLGTTDQPFLGCWRGFRSRSSIFERRNSPRHLTHILGMLYFHYGERKEPA